MRFVRKEHIVTTIFNKELTEADEIRTVFKNLFDYRIDFSMIMKKYISSSYDFTNMSFEKVRIKKIYEDDILDLIVFKNGVKTTMKKVSYEDIVEVNATTTKHKILDVDSDVSRWDLLDVRED